MKQGSGSSRKGDGKREPIPHAISINGVTNIGLQQVYTKQPPGLYKSDGYRAPMGASTSHPKGSQGKR